MSCHVQVQNAASVASESLRKQSPPGTQETKSTRHVQELNLKDSSDDNMLIAVIKNNKRDDWGADWGATVTINLQ